ncbi:MAG TPA: S-methyl-5'-thioadenosine phosphorylase [Candidatus Dormibacteraeota bacterium]
MARGEVVGIFGGSGLYQLLEGAREVRVETPYGPPSDSIWLGEIAARKVAFMPRHGRDHSLPPHRINFRANLYALHQAGVGRILAPCAVGSLQREIAPGDVVIPSQFVDRTWGRADTYWEGPVVQHVSAADPYCPELSAAAATAAARQGATVHQGQTLVVIQGPRFSTRAESRWFSGQGWGVIGMTGYPEAILARELGICYSAIALVTDYDAGLEGSADIAPVTHEEVLRVFAANIGRVRQILFDLVEELPPATSCGCSEGLPLPQLAATP